MKHVLTGFIGEAFEHGKQFGNAGAGQVQILIGERPCYQDRKLTIEISESMHKLLLRKSHDLAKIKITIEIKP